MNKELMMYSAGKAGLQPLSQDLQLRKEAVLRCYGDRVAFLNRFSPDKQMTLCRDENLAILDESPTLTDINITYGRNTAVMFLIPQLLNISEFCGARDKFTDRQIEELAQMIASNYQWLKVLEFMTFCKQFKMGVYGLLYGSVDPMAILKAIRKFLDYRRDVYSDYERFIALRRIEEEKKKPHITYEQWRKMKEEKGEKINLTEDKLKKIGYGYNADH